MRRDGAIALLRPGTTSLGRRRGKTEKGGGIGIPGRPTAAWTGRMQLLMGHAALNAVQWNLVGPSGPQLYLTLAAGHSRGAEVIATIITGCGRFRGSCQSNRAWERPRLFPSWGLAQIDRRGLDVTAGHASDVARRATTTFSQSARDRGGDANSIRTNVRITSFIVCASFVNTTLGVALALWRPRIRIKLLHRSCRDQRRTVSQPTKAVVDRTAPGANGSPTSSKAPARRRRR